MRGNGHAHVVKEEEAQEAKHHAEEDESSPCGHTDGQQAGSDRGGAYLRALGHYSVDIHPDEHTLEFPSSVR